MAAAKKNTSYKNVSSGRKTGLIIVIGIVILLLIPLTVWWLGSLEKKNSDAVSYQGDSYKFSYPKEWTIQTMDMSDIQGKELFLQPPHGGPPKTPYIMVEVAPATEDAVKTLTDPFTIFRYQEADVMLNGIHAKKYKTIVHAAEGVLHATDYVFEAKGKIYLIGVGYKQEVPDQQLEEEFAQVVNSFSLR